MVRPSGRIFILAFHISPNDARYLKLRKSFETAGFAVHAAAPLKNGEACAAGVAGIPVGERPASRIGAWLWARRLAGRLAGEGARFKPDLVYIFDPEALPAALRVRRLTGAGVIYDAHEFHQEEQPGAHARSAWVRRMESRAADRLDAFVTVNASIARLYRSAQPGFPPAIVVHNAVDPPPASAYDGRLHAAAGLGRDARILLYQGQLAPMRGLDTLLSAAPLLAPEWSLVIMGSGPLAGDLRNRADKSRTVFLEPAPHAELLAWTSGASLGALLYEDIGQNQHYCSPNKLWEYAAAGTPALASDLPEIARIVGGHGTGFLVPPGADAPQVAAAVNTLSPDALHKAVQAAKAFSLRETWTSQAEPLIARMEQLCRNRLSRG